MISTHPAVRTLSHSKGTCVCVFVRNGLTLEDRPDLSRTLRRVLQLQRNHVGASNDVLGAAAALDAHLSDRKKSGRIGAGCGSTSADRQEWQEGQSRVRAPPLRSLRHTRARAHTPDIVRTEMRRLPAQREPQRLRPPARDLPTGSMGRPPAFERTTPCRSAARSPAQEGCACRDGWRKGRAVHRTEGSAKERARYFERSSGPHLGSVHP